MISFGGSGSVFQHVYFYLQIVQKKSNKQIQIESDDEDFETKLSKILSPNRKNRNIEECFHPVVRVIHAFAPILFISFFLLVAVFCSYRAYKNGDYGQNLNYVEIKMNDEIDFSNISIYNKTRLPSNIKPSSYVLYIYPDMKNNNMTGLVRIKVKCTSKTDTVVLHFFKHLLKTTRVVESATQRQDIGIKKILRNREKSFVILYLNETLQEGEFYDLYLSFYMELTYIDSNGVYLSQYVDGRGQRKIMLSTVFEKNLARNAFPCFDEPALKATFKLIIQHNSSYKAFSNMPVDKVLNYGVNKETHFKVTPKMSTYLVGFVVTQYVSRQVYTKRGIQIRVFAPAGRLDETSYALKLTPSIMNFYAENLEVNYTLLKLDLVPVSAFPGAADALVGMVLFQESFLLRKPHSINKSYHI